MSLEQLLPSAVQAPAEDPAQSLAAGLPSEPSPAAALRIRARSHQAIRCAFCHDHLEGDPRGCPGCGARLHRACRRELGRCPTHGCASSSRGAPRPPRRRRAPVAVPPGPDCRPRRLKTTVVGLCAGSVLFLPLLLELCRSGQLPSAVEVGLFALLVEMFLLALGGPP